MTKTILILAIAAAFVAGTIATGTIAIADDDKLTADLSGSNEVPPVVTGTTGEAEFDVNKAMTKIKYKLKVKNGDDILGAAGAHIHCAQAGFNGPVILFLAGMIPTGLDGKVKIEGTLSTANILDDSCGSTISAIVDSMKSGGTYVNVHSSANPSGEVRGQIESADQDDDDDDD